MSRALLPRLRQVLLVALAAWFLGHPHSAQLGSPYRRKLVPEIDPGGTREVAVLLAVGLALSASSRKRGADGSEA